VSFLFFTATYVIASLIGYGAVTCLISGLTTVALTMPLTSPPMYSESFWWHSPYAIPLLYMFSTLLITVRLIGRLSVVANLLATVALILESLWVIVGGARFVLPFEFSRCLVIETDADDARIDRVDFLTGLTFQKTLDAELRFRFGPFENAGCRLADLADIQTMGVNAKSVAEFTKRYPGHFVFEGLF
jgi:hypothetical protein